MAGRPTAPPSSARSPDSAVPLARDCSIARALEVVGEQWTLLIIRDAIGRGRFLPLGWHGRSSRIEASGPHREQGSNHGKRRLLLSLLGPGDPQGSGYRVSGGGSVGENIFFAEGPFLSLVGHGWSSADKNPPTRRGLITAVTTLYQRVHGHPAG
jgi:hypothetical protein